MANTYGLNVIKIGGVWFFRGQKTPIRGTYNDKKKDWNYRNLPYLVANTYGLNVIKIGGIWIFWGQKPPIRGVTCDLWCPFMNSDELFQSKVMCENLVQIGWAFQELSFEFSGGVGARNLLLGGLHVTCDAHFRIWSSYSSQKSCVKIWFWLVEPFKGYCVHKHFSWEVETTMGGGGGYIWPVMPIFELGCAIEVQCHVLKFGLDCLKSEVC